MFRIKSKGKSVCYFGIVVQVPPFTQYLGVTKAGMLTAYKLRPVLINGDLVPAASLLTATPVYKELFKISYTGKSSDSLVRISDSMLLDIDNCCK